MSSTFKVGDHLVPFRQTQETLKVFASILALIPQLPLYSDLGLNLVSKPRLIGLTVFLLGMSKLGNLMFSFSLFGGFQFASGNDWSLAFYALFILLPLGLWQNRERLMEEKRGDKPVNSWWPGVPRLSFLPLPEYVIRMGVNPGACFIAGAFLHYEVGAGLLGLWLMLSALALFIVEWTVRRQTVQHGRDLRDRMDEGERDAAMMRPSPREEKAGGIATSSDAGLAAEIEKRRNQQSNDSHQGGFIQ